MLNNIKLISRGKKCRLSSGATSVVNYVTKNGFRVSVELVTEFGIVKFVPGRFSFAYVGDGSTACHKSICKKCDYHRLRPVQ